MKIFDLHCHPTLKPMLMLEENRKNPWEEIDNWVNKIYDSQSNLEQLLDGGCNLACVGVGSIETAFLTGALVQTLAGPVRYVDKRQLKRIARMADGYRYPQLLEQEFNSINQYPDNPFEEWEHVKWIKSMDEYDPDDMDTLHLIASQEGGHGLYYGKNESDDIDIMLDKISVYRSGEPVRLLYLTLTHISQNVFANHAYAIKILGKKPFLPLGNGITTKGHQIIKACLDTESPGKPILLDIKHLSLVARKEYYAAYSHMPMIASHMAVTGCSWHEKPIVKVRKKRAHEVYKVKYERQRGHIEGTYFNPDSINLYDEDIQAIIKSDGLIGIILDERVLGYSKDKTSKEFISNDEWDAFIAPVTEEGLRLKLMSDDEDQLDDEADQELDNEDLRLIEGQSVERSRDKRYIHLLHLLNNIVHIIKVGQSMGEEFDASKHIVIGSDFDGLVNPIDCCLTAVEFGSLKDSLAEAIELYTLDLIPDPASFVEDVFYKNGITFLNKYFR